MLGLMYAEVCVKEAADPNLSLILMSPQNTIWISKLPSLLMWVDCSGVSLISH